MKYRHLAIAAAVVFCTAVPVFANSGMTFWEGTDNTGVVSSDQDCPLTVTHEDLDLYINDLPKTNYSSIEEFLSYDSSLKAEYTFFNPSDMHVKALLSFPLGKLPVYSYNVFEDREYDPELVKIRDGYSILVNGQEADVKLRGTYLYYEDFDIQKDIAKLKDTYTDHPFYRHDMPVTRYEFSIEGIDEKETAAAVRYSFEADSSKTKLSFHPFNGGTVSEGSCDVQVWAEAGKVTVYVIGEDLEEVPEWRVVRSGDNDTEIDGDVKLVSKETMTLEEYVLSKYDGSWGIPETDYYNAWITMADQQDRSLPVIEEVDIYSSSMLYWYQYEIELDPGESLVNTVTAPLYLSIDTGYEDPVYSYTYYLSPASTWKEFGSLDINIHTDLNLLECVPEQVVKTEGGYRISLTELPEGELEFSVCTVESPKKKRMNYGIPAVYLVIPAALIIFLVWLSRRK